MNGRSYMLGDVELPSGKCSESAGTIWLCCVRHCCKILHVNAFTSRQRLAFHSGHSLSSHRCVVGGFVLVSQLISLSLHSNERVLIPEPQVTEHCKRKEKTISYTKRSTRGKL